MEVQQIQPNRRRRLRIVEESQMCLTDITIERVSTNDDPEDLVKPGILSVFGIAEGEENGTPFTLSEVSLNRWGIVNNVIRLPKGLEAVDCVVRSEAGDDIGSTQLSCGQAGHSSEGEGLSKIIETLDIALQFRIAWETLQIQVVTSMGWVEDRVVNDDIDGLCQRASSMFSKFRRSQSLTDISEAISMQQRAVDMASVNPSVALPSSVDDLGTMFRARFEFTGCLSDIAGAISAHTRAVHVIPEGHSSGLPSYLSNLGDSFLLRSEHTGDLEDIASAMSAHIRAVSLTSDGHAELPSRLHRFGNAFLCLFRRTGDLKDLVEAISKYSRSIELTPEGCRELPRYLSNLGVSLLDRFDYTGDVQDITEAISAHTRAVGLTPEGHASLPDYLNNLGVSFLRRFERTENVQDISEAISRHNSAVSLTPDGHARLPFMLRSLGNSLRARFKHTGDLHDIAEAISLHSRVVALTPEGHIALPAHLDHLGYSFTSRFERTGDLEDITKAISAHKEAVSLTPEGHADLHSHFNNMGSSFMYRFDHTGDLDDITEAIAAHSRAVRLTPEGHFDLPSRFNNLGNSFISRFELTGDPQDIREGISAHQRAVGSTREDDPHLPSFLDNLGISFQVHAKHTGDASDVGEAISAHEKAVHLTPEDHVDLSSHLSNLGSAFMSRFNLTDDLGDISEAISMHTRVVRLIPEGHRALPASLNGLGNALLCRFKRTGNLQDATEAVSAHTRALSLAPEGRADIPSYLINLGQSWLHLFTSSSLPKHFEESISSYKLAATCTFGSPRTRIEAAARWAALLDRPQPHATDVLTAFDTAIRLLTLTAGLEQTVQHRHTIIQKCAHLPLYAAASAFRLEHLDSAVEWLEQGRCLVWGQQSKLRAPLDELRIHDAVLSDRIRDISRRLDRAGSSSRNESIGMHISEKISLEDEARTHLHLAREWEALLKTARTIPGFETFLQPSAFAALVGCLPESGPVVIINVHASRCDAIALLAGLNEALHIPLPMLSLEKATEFRRALTIQLRSGGLRQREEDNRDIGCDDAASQRALRPPGYRPPPAVPGVKDILEWLWEAVVKPILDALAISKGDARYSVQLPRVWWCPTGPLSFLPLHAAGIYRGPEMEGVMDYVVSSYTPTVTALTQRVKNDCPIDVNLSGLFLTCQPNAPGASSIAGTTKEVASIYDQATIHGINTAKQEGDAVTAEECLEFMEKFSSIHLACHASQNATEPLKSRFLFHKGSLNLNDIMRRDLKNADLAFLSACETSTGEETLSDEAVHLAAGMLAAGYRRVVATMWRIGDADAPRIAEDFYQYLWDHRKEGSGARFDGALSAYALHHATQKLRARLGNADSSLLAWVPYVHYGY